MKPKSPSIKYPYSNVIVERVHQVVGYILRTHEIKDYAFYEIDPWGIILQDIAWEIRSTYHTTTQESPGQLVFSIDMFFNIPYTPEWNSIDERKQSLINKSNQAKNKSQLDHDYEFNDQVLIYREDIPQA